MRRAAVVVGHGAERVVKKLHAEAGGLPLEFVEQVHQRGTGDAAAVGLSVLPTDDADEPGDVIVLPGDTPLLEPETIANLLEHHRETGAACTVLTAHLEDPTDTAGSSAGRDDRVDADRRAVRRLRRAELAIDEVNTSIYCFKRGFLAPALRRISPENAQGELYLTDAVGGPRGHG